MLSKETSPGGNGCVSNGYPLALLWHRLLISPALRFFRIIFPSEFPPGGIEEYLSILADFREICPRRPPDFPKGKYQFAANALFTPWHGILSKSYEFK